MVFKLSPCTPCIWLCLSGSMRKPFYVRCFGSDVSKGSARWKIEKLLLVLGASWVWGTWFSRLSNWLKRPDIVSAHYRCQLKAKSWKKATGTRWSFAGKRAHRCIAPSLLSAAASWTQVLQEAPDGSSRMQATWGHCALMEWKAGSETSCA